MTPFVRFAPSPTGYLHVGNVRTALVNWLYARKARGRFLLRLDDTDTERSKSEYAASIEEDLSWLGITWDDFKKQSDRMEAYEAARNKLTASGRLYPCYETGEELEIRRKLQAGRGLPPIYDRAALKLTDEQKAKYVAEDRKPHWRFMLEAKPIVWHDLIRGEVKFEGVHASDPVLIRADGVPLYTLASVVDDGEMGITHIIRGEDHVSNTAVQVQIFEALGFTPPAFGHLALLKTKEGELSKRVGGNDIRSLRDAGFEPMAINSLLAKMGTSDAIEPFANMDALVAAFDISKFGRATANYDAHDLERLNEKLLSHLPFTAVKDRLRAVGLKHEDEPFWNAVRGNIRTLREAEVWWNIVCTDSVHKCHSRAGGNLGQDPRLRGGDKEGIREYQDFLVEALRLLPPEPWDETSWGAWTKALSEKTGRKGRELFMPLRLALTGLEHGPEMKLLLPLIGRDKVLRRLVWNP
jgi:glutamyl-tRNA synthetase